MNDKNIKLNEKFNLGFENFQKNNLTEAENLFNEVLRFNPKHIESNFFLGILYAQNKNLNKAKEFFIQVIKLNSNFAEAHYNLGLVYFRLEEYRNSVKCYEKSIEINPKNFDSHNNLGVTYNKLREYKKALNCYEKAKEIDPKNSEVYNNFGIAYFNLKNLEKAEEFYQKGLIINSKDHRLHDNLGLVFFQLGKFQEAKKAHEKAIQIDPNHFKAYNNLGLTFSKLKEFEKAISFYEKAIKLKNDYVDAYHNIGLAYKDLGEVQKAKTYYEKAIKINPSHKEANFSLGTLLLSMKDFEKGFEQYEWRTKPFLLNKLKSLEWQGEDLNNKTILIIYEQGWGDVIQFFRYLYLLKEKYSVDIIFRVKKPIMHLFSKSNFILVTEDDTLPEHDYHKYLMSLPQIFYKTTKKFAKEINYIPENEKIYLNWKNKLEKIKGFKVGICWQGRKTHPADHLRSIPLNYFERFFDIKGVQFISLQKGFGTEQINNFKYKNKLYDFSNKNLDIDENNVFMDTIGVLKNIDLVITIDSAIAHLSGTLGIKTWMLLQYYPDWRWSLQSENFSWYDSLKIYKSKNVSEWDSILNILKNDLIKLLNNKMSF